MARILVVEDNPANLELVQQLLEEKHEVLSARDGVEGVAVAKRERPDLILMDLSLPRLNGWSALTQLRADDATKGIPVVALTAHAPRGERERSLALGFDDYVPKPVDEEVLWQVVDRLLKGRAGGTVPSP